MATYRLDEQTLEELGLGTLPPEEKRKMLTHILETLEMRVGTTLASKMSDAQLDEFEKLMPVESDTQEIVKDKEKAALTWLETNFPDYKAVVSNELTKLKDEIKAVAPQILSESAQNQAQLPQA